MFQKELSKTPSYTVLSKNINLHQVNSPCQNVGKQTLCLTKNIHSISYILELSLPLYKYMGLIAKPIPTPMRYVHWLDSSRDISCNAVPPIWTHCEQNTRWYFRYINVMGPIRSYSRGCYQIKPVSHFDLDSSAVPQLDETHFDASISPATNTSLRALGDTGDASISSDIPPPMTLASAQDHIDHGSSIIRTAQMTTKRRVCIGAVIVIASVELLKY